MNDKYIYLAIILIIGTYLAPVLYKVFSKKRIENKIKRLASDSIEISPQVFLNYRKKIIKQKRGLEKKENFKGVYIIHNKTKDLFYVGQAHHILDRVNQHFTGHGNGDVYADYKYGDTFTIRMIGLYKSGYNTLNELERYAIETYGAYKKGYNKTRGNKDYGNKNNYK